MRRDGPKRRLPCLPVPDVAIPSRVEPVGQTGSGAPGGFGRGAAEAQSQHELAARLRRIHFARQRDVAILGAVVAPRHARVCGQVLPAIRHPDEPGRPHQPVRRTGQRQGAALAFSEQHGPTLVLTDPRRVVAAAVGQMRCEQNVKAIVARRALQRHEARALQHDRPRRVGQDLLFDAIAALEAGVRQPERRDPVGQPRDLMSGMALLLRDETAAIGDDEAQVAGAGLVHAWIVDLVEDAVAHGEPDAALAGGCRAHTRLGAGRPARVDAGPAGRVGERSSHREFQRHREVGQVSAAVREVRIVGHPAVHEHGATGHV